MSLPAEILEEALEEGVLVDGAPYKLACGAMIVFRSSSGLLLPDYT